MTWLVALRDQSNSTSLFRVECSPSRATRLAQTLQRDPKATVANVVTCDRDILAVITQDDDGTGFDSLILAGRGQLRRRLGHELQPLETRIETYLTETATANTSDEWSDAVERLAAVADG